ncbi:MAG: MlaD family protein [Pseudomonadota bacterium]
MKRDNVNYVLAGAVVLAGMSLLFVVLYQLTGRSGASDNYYTFYRQVAGLRYGTPVYFEGYRIGQIESISPQRDGGQTTFRIDFTVEEDWPIPSDSVAAIATSGLLSDVFIVLNQGESAQLLQPDSEIIGREASDIFGSLNALADDVSDLTESHVEPLLELLATRVDTITANLESSTPVLVDDVTELLARLNDSAESLKTLMGQDNVNNVSTILSNFSQTSADAQLLVSELAEARSELRQLIADLGAIASDNRDGISGTVSELETSVLLLSQRLDSITFNLDEASRNLNEFARAIRRSPNRLLFSPEADETGANPR